jgi:hypothetical protein
MIAEMSDLAAQSPPEKAKRRALPAHIIDTIRDGATPDDIRRRGDLAVWDRLVSTAASAQQRGWPRTEWAAVVTHGSSLLGVQVHRKHDTDPPKPRSPADSERTLTRAWEAAAQWLAQAPPAFTRETALVRVEKIAQAAAQAALTDTDRAVLTHALNEARRIGTDRPALPRRTIVQKTGLGERAVRNALERLVGLGWLTVEDRGASGSLRKRAALYKLNPPVPGSGALIPRGARSEGPSLLCGTPSSQSANPTYGSADSDPLPSNVIPFPRRGDQ